MSDFWLDCLYKIYEACRGIPNWIENLRPYHDQEDLDYWERLKKMERA